MQLYVRLFLICAAVIFVAIMITEQPQTATTKSRLDRAATAFCSGFVDATRKRGLQTKAARSVIFNVGSGITARLPWKLLFDRPAVGLGDVEGPATESFDSSVSGARQFTYDAVFSFF